MKNTKKHILILNWRDTKHPLAGGAEAVTHIYAIAWIEQGYQVTQISCSFEGCEETETIDGVRIIRMGNHYTVHAKAAQYYLNNLKGSVDIIVDEFHFIPFMSVLYARVPIVGFIHELARTLWFQNTNILIATVGYLIEPIIVWLYRNKQFITVSKSTKEELVSGGIDKDAIEIIPNGFTNPYTNTLKKAMKPTIVYLGRVTKDKGIEDALSALAKLKYIGGIQLWVIGMFDNPYYEARIKQLVKDLGLEQHVTFYGHVSQKKKFSLLSKSWILINSSPREGWGLVNIEANSCRVPVVGYDVPGTRDSVVHKSTGLLVPKHDVDKLSIALKTLIEDTALRNRYSTNALRHSKNYSWEKTAKQSADFMNKVVATYYGKKNS